MKSLLVLNEITDGNPLGPFKKLPPPAQVVAVYPAAITSLDNEDVLVTLVQFACVINGANSNTPVRRVRSLIIISPQTRIHMAASAVKIHYHHSLVTDN